MVKMKLHRIFKSKRAPISESPVVRMSTAGSGNVVEIFSGIQGEGIHVGRRQIFLRLAGCNLRCDYCDQPEARQIPRKALIEQTPGRRDFSPAPNPLSVEQAARAVVQLNRPKGLHHAVALTGGEPLMQAQFLAALLPLLRRTGLRILLETNGTRPDEFIALRHLVDIVSMDFKLRSATGRPMPVKAHKTFLRLAARAGKETYVKAVVSSRTTDQEIAGAAKLIAGIKRAVPLVLQPVSGHPFDRALRQAQGREQRRTAQDRFEDSRTSGRRQSPSPARLLELQAAAAEILPEVRVIPQTHKIIGQK